MPYQDNSTQPIFPAPVQIGGTHRYVVNGDEVTLEAELHVVDPVAASYLNWTLQLWADEVLVADAFFGALYPDSFGIARVGATTAANLPAGTGEHRMTLALAGDDGAGLQRFDAVSYPRHEHFPLPRIEGAVAYRFEEGHTEISAEGIRNPRPADNMSGSLVLELWALPAAYQGGAFSGILIGSEFIGVLAGQSQWNNICARLPACELPEGRWHLVLMLREWVGHTYLTRDYRNFALTVDGPLPAPGSAPEALPAAPAPTIPASSAASAKVAEAKADQKAAAKTAPKAAEKKNTTAAASRPATSDSVSPAKRSAKQSTPAHKLARVSVNTASVGDLSAVRGINSTTAEGIVAGRPWKSLDDLIAVKGIGSKSLDKLKPLLKL